MKKIIICDKVKTYRKENKLTQEEFGEIIGISAQAVSKWERVECYPDIFILPDLARLFNCRVDDFFIKE